MVTILSIDPGNKLSAWMIYEGGVPITFGHDPNEDVLQRISAWLGCPTVIVIEKIAAMGMAVGAEVFDTAQWSGRFIQAAFTAGVEWSEVKRAEVKMHLCGNMRAKDPNIRQALIDRFGGKEAAIGKKKNPGPLFGIAGDCWAALAVAVTYADKHGAAGAAE